MKRVIILLAIIVISTISNCIVAQIPTDGLIGFWPFNGNANDESGNGNNGVVHGATLTEDRFGNLNSAYYLDGINDYISILNSGSLNPQNAFTLCAWYKASDVFGAGYSPIIDKGYTSHISPYYQYKLGVGGSYLNQSNFKFSVTTNNFENKLQASDGYWMTNNWYFLVGTYDGSKMEFYVNNQLIQSISVTGLISSYNTPVYFGNNTTKDDFLKGVIDDIILYNRTLSFKEINAIYLLNKIIGSNVVCQGPQNVNYSILNNAEFTSYSWNYSGTGLSFTGSGNSISANFTEKATSGKLSVTVTGNTIGSLTTEIPIAVKELPPPSGTISGKSNICINQTGIDYSITALNNTDTYNWDYTGTGAKIIGSSNAVKIDFSSAATNGILTVFAKNICGSGITSPELSININHPPANPDLIIGYHEVCQNQGEYTFSIPRIGNTNKYKWEYSGNGASIIGDKDSVTIYFFNNATSGNLSVYANNLCGNSAKSQNFPVIVKNCNENPAIKIEIPNAFSPNGDGINDFFIIKGLVQHTHVMIFDRLGKLLYESNNYINDWDGKDSNGQAIDTGTYWYIISIPGITNEFKGFVYLKR